jgi:hypothetical protein
MRASSVEGGRRLRWLFLPDLQLLEDRTLPSYYGNQLFPLDNPWNERITSAPVAANSAAIIQHIINAHGGGSGPALHPDFGNPVIDQALYGIPINVVGAGQPAVPVVIPNFGYGGESDNPGAPIPIPIPAGAVIEGDGPNGPADPSLRGDSHLLVYDKDANKLYELYQATRPTETIFPSGDPHPLGQWGAFQESVWDLNTNTFRTLGWTSADAAGLPIMPGLVRPDEALPPSQGGQGVINHAIRMTVNDTLGDPNLANYIYPASHFASNKTGTDLPRMGERFRLKAGTIIPTTWSPEAKAIAQAMKDYGLIVADNGSDMFFTGIPSTQWNDDNLNVLKSLHASDFEVVDLTPAVTSLSVTGGATGGGTVLTINGHGFSGAAGNLHVMFGTTPAANFSIVSDTQINVVAPPHAAGTVDVQIVSGNVKTDVNSGRTALWGYGSSALNAGDRFTYSAGTGVNIARAYVVVGADAGGSPDVRIFGNDGNLRTEFFAYAPSFAGGVRVATGDVNGDGVPDIVTAPGPGGGPDIRVWDGATGQLVREFMAYSPQFVGGVYVAVGDVNGDGHADIITGAGPGGGPHVKVFDGATGGVLASFFAYASTFTGGVRVAAGDVNGDGKADVITGAGPGGGPHIRAFTIPSLTQLRSFFAFGNSFTGGIFVTAGDLDGDHKAEIIVSQDQSTTAVVRVFRGSDGAQVGEFTPFASGPPQPNGVRVTLADFDADNQLDVIVSSGSGARRVRAFKGSTLALISQFDAFNPGFLGGVFIG